VSIIQIIVLAVIQGFAELLPVSSSAHVIFAQHLMGIDPSAPAMTFLLVMLHTGTMFAVLVFFWSRWKNLLTIPGQARPLITNLILATAATGVVGLGLKIIIEKVIFEKILKYPKGEVEELFRILPLMAASLFLVGILIIFAGLKRKPTIKSSFTKKESVKIGIIQGLCLPFRGFSRSGATISVALLQGIEQRHAEEFSFALAVLLTPPVILLELKRLYSFNATTEAINFSQLIGPALLGMLFSFGAGLLALRWLSSWLEKGRWPFFGYYCIGFSAIVTVCYFLNI
jgi:undecaprenyl-diphosphatase